VSIASWAGEDVSVKLNIDWQKLGIDPSRAKLVAPAVKNFQPAQTFSIDGDLPVAKAKGWLLIIK